MAGGTFIFETVSDGVSIFASYAPGQIHRDVLCRATMTRYDMPLTVLQARIKSGT